MSNTSSQTLNERLCDRIARHGPITFRDWMEAALYDPSQGYYCRKDLPRWGRQGDYRTSPETSVLFAATFARYFANIFQQIGSPSRFTLVEVGGGAGYFAQELLETLHKHFTRVFNAITYVFDEVSFDSRERAAERLRSFRDQVEFKHLLSVDPFESGIIFSNELFDAFPVHRITLRHGEVRELYIGLDEHNQFNWVDGPPSTSQLTAFLDRFRIHLIEDQIIEINLGLENFYAVVSEKMTHGYLVTVDYGLEAKELYDSTVRREGTLRSFSRHTLSPNALGSPGEQDITSSVDWTAAMALGEDFGFRTCIFERQDRFLLRVGLLDELEAKVAKTTTESAKLRLRASVRDLILPGGLGASFQVLVQKR